MCSQSIKNNRIWIISFGSILTSLTTLATSYLLITFDETPCQWVQGIEVKPPNKDRLCWSDDFVEFKRKTGWTCVAGSILCIISAIISTKSRKEDDSYHWWGIVNNLVGFIIPIYCLCKVKKLSSHDRFDFLKIMNPDPWVYSDLDEPEYYWLFENRNYGNYGDYIRYEDTWQYLLEKTTYDEKTYQYEHLVFLLIVGFSVLIAVSHIVIYFPWECCVCCFCPDKDAEKSSDEEETLQNNDLESGRTEAVLEPPTAPQISDFKNTPTISNKLLGVQVIQNGEMEYILAGQKISEFGAPPNKTIAVRLGVHDRHPPFDSKKEIDVSDVAGVQLIRNGEIEFIPEGDSLSKLTSPAGTILVVQSQHSLSINLPDPSLLPPTYEESQLM